MSIVAGSTWAAAPSTTRGQPTVLSADSKGERLAYAVEASTSRSHKSVFLRSIDHPDRSTQYTAHTTQTTVARFAPSGYYVASGDVSGTVRIWDCVGEGITKGVYPIISGRINDIAWDGESRRIIAVGEGRERFGRCITSDSGNSVGEIIGHSLRINSVAIRQQRPLRAATASDDTNVVFMHGVPFKYNASLVSQHSGFVYGVAYSPDGEQLVSVGGDKKIWLYDGKTGEAKIQIGQNEHKGSIYGVSWAPDSSRFVTSSADQTVKIWDVETGKAIQSWKLGENSVAGGVPFHQVGVVWPQGRSDGLIISLSLNGDLNYFNDKSPQTTRQVHGHQGNITSVTAPSSASTKSPTLWTSGVDGRVCSWNVEDGTSEWVEGQGHKSYISGLATHVAGEGKISEVYTVGWDDTLRSIDSAKRQYTSDSTKLQGQPSAVALCESNVVVVVTNTSVEVFENSQKLGQIETKYTPTCVTAASKSVIVVGGDDATIRLYSLSGSSLQLEKEIKSSTTPVTALALSAESKSLVAGHSSGKLIVYRLEDGSVLTDRWTAHTGRITCLAWTRNNINDNLGHIVSGSLDSSIYIWSVASPTKVLVKMLNAHKEGVNGVQWIEDSKRVVSVGGDASVKFWDVTGL